YPDLEIHRIIKEQIKFGISDKREKYLSEFVEKASKQASTNERHAEEAERELDSLKKAEYMEDKIGEEFEGIIGSITNFGMFIELPNTIEGLVHISDMDDDYYVYDEVKMNLTGENTQKVYSLGDKIKIRVSKVDLDTREIFFEIDND
ncbi:MAG: S1 RNA-binding domain-containing protein, partial [Clostridium sp.]|nr:S1 RNA-binding domain-containing protein [Clostridium sp.]